MAVNNDHKILNAIRLHLVLLNVGNEAVQFNLTELIKQKDATNPNAVKDFLIKNYQGNPKHFLEGFLRTLYDNFGDKTSDFPNDLKIFDISACYQIARKFPKLQMDPFDDLRKIRNKQYGHLNLLEIDDIVYTNVLNELKKIIDNFTQKNPEYQRDLRYKISEIERIQALSSIKDADMENLKEIIVDLILKNRNMFSQIVKVNTDIEAFTKIYEQAQTSHSNKIEEIRQLSSRLITLAQSIKSKNISQEEIIKIAEVVSSYLNLKRCELNFEETLRHKCEDIKSHISTKVKELENHVDRRFDSLDKTIKDGLKLEQPKCK